MGKEFSEAESTLPIKRGQVWLVYEDRRISAAKIAANSRIQAKTRPYLIMTADQFISKPVVYGIPLTHNITNEEDNNDIVVTYQNDKSRIMMNQLTAIDLIQVKKYMFTLTDNVMHEIDSALLRLLGISSVRNSVNDENKLSSKSYSKTVSMKKKRVMHKWDDKTLALFLDDSKHMSLDDMKNKWSVATSTYYKALKLARERENEGEKYDK